MRSPVAHHLDVEAESLLEYAHRHGRERELLQPYRRPSLGAFDDHCRSVIDRFRLQELVVPGRVEAITRTARGYRLELTRGAIESRALVLASGLRGHERIPDWAGALVGPEWSRIRHAAEVKIGDEPLDGADVLIIGGGLSAGTLAAGAVRRGAKVTLVFRRPLEARLFDADPGWVGPKYLRWFHAEERPEARLRMIERARGRAAMTPELLDELNARRRAGSLVIVCGEVVAVRPEPAALSVRFSAQAAERRFETIWLATGFAPATERLEWLHGLGPLQCHRGRPILPPSLELAPHCFASGWLAELEIGPTARNISGARSAAVRIAARIFDAANARSAA
jgi:cation diffusion facilitator CzcD-associated flavoprotein CzcO